MGIFRQQYQRSKKFQTDLSSFDEFFSLKSLSNQAQSHWEPRQHFTVLFCKQKDDQK